VAQKWGSGEGTLQEICMLNLEFKVSQVEQKKREFNVHDYKHFYEIKYHFLN